MPDMASLMGKELKHKVVIKHSRIEINDYEPGQSSYLEYVFSVFDPVKHQRFPKGSEYDEKTKRLIVPRGMNLDPLKRHYSDIYVDPEHDPFTSREPLTIKYLPKDERQLKIIKFILGRDEYRYTLAKSQLAVNSTTGSGKTYVTVATMCYTGARMIIITNSVNWLQQWKDRILEYTSLTDDDIYMIVGRDTINKILTRDVDKYQVFLVSHATIRAYGDSVGWDKVDDLFKALKCSIKVFDESHLYFDNMVKIDFHSNTYKTIYLTATPARSNKDEDLIYKEYFRFVPSITLFNEEIDPHVNYVGMLFYSYPSPDDVRNYSVGQFNFDRNIYVSYLVNRPNFLKLVTFIIDMTLKIDGKVLIYIGMNAAIQFIRSYIIHEFPFLERAIGIYTSLTPKEQKEEMLRKKFILSTTKSCGAAQDIHGLAVTVVLAEPFCSEVLARQTLGRCRADNTLYIDCVDMSCFRTGQYYKKKKPIFNKYAKSCRETIMTQEMLDQKYAEIHHHFTDKKLMTIPVFKS